MALEARKSGDDHFTRKKSTRNDAPALRVFAWHRNTTHLFRVGKPQRMGMFGQLWTSPRWGYQGRQPTMENWTETVTLWQPGILLWQELQLIQACWRWWFPNLSSTNEKHPLLETHIWLSVGKIPICVREVLIRVGFSWTYTCGMPVLYDCF